MAKSMTTSRALESSPISQPRSMRRRTDETPDLPLYHRHSNCDKREISCFWSPEKLVHVIPLLVLLCLFILWWFSHPEMNNLEEMNKDGSISMVYRSMYQSAEATNQPLSLPPQPEWISELQMEANE